MTTTNSAGVDISYLAMRVFEEDCIASGNRPNDHYDREAAEQWTAEALRASGIVELIEAVLARRVAPMGTQWVDALNRETDALKACGINPAALAGNGKEGA